MQYAFRFTERGVPVAPRGGRPLRARTGGMRQAAGGGAAGGGGRGAHCGAGAGRSVSTGGPGPVRDPVSDLLADLRGREVTLQVGNRLLSGKLIMTDPVVLVDGEGRATFVRAAAIVAVTF